MDRPPFDIDALARIANDLFRGNAAVPGPTEIPSVVQASPPAVDTGVDAAAPHGFGLPAGGATLAPQAPPTRPALGRTINAEKPIVAHGVSDAVPYGFDPQALPGFAPIPAVEDGFADIGRLIPSEAASTPYPTTPGLAPGVLPPGAAGYGFDRQAADGFVPFGQSAAPVPSAPQQHASFGRPLPGDVPASLFDANQFGTGTPAGPNTPATFGAASVPGLPQASAFDPQTYISTALQYPHDEEAAGRLEPRGLQAASSLDGLLVRDAPRAPHHEAHGSSGALPATPTKRRSIDRPTPNAFDFTDAPHLGEFDEQSILRAALDPQNGAPSIEGLGNLPAPRPDPYAGGLVPSATPSFYFLDDRMDYFGDDVPDVPRPSATPFNAEAVRRDFPVLHQSVNGHPLVWLDNGATTQKPQVVIDAISRFYERDNSNISRSAHELAARATNAYEDARKTVQRFINASQVEEIVFLRGTTEGINLVAQSFGRRFIKAGDEILLTHGEHHANIVPWYNLAKEVGAHLKVVPFDDNGEILLDEYEQLLNHRVKIVATTHVANALGTILPVKAMTEMAHRHGIPVLVDGAQSISHMPIDVQDIDCDFYVFSGHKLFAPTGIGALYGKKALLEQMPPWQGGGNMIKDVTFEKITFQPPPLRFEAGTGNIADAIGLAEAIKYLERLGMTNVESYEHALLDYATQKLAPIKGLTTIGNAKAKAGVISFVLDSKEPAEVGKALNQKGIAVRAGHHCALPILRRYGVEATVRPAFALYNTFEDADRLADAVREIAAN